MADYKLAKLVLKWTDGDKTYRMIAKAKATTGYEDSYVVEKLGQSELGEPRWDYFCMWTAEPHGGEMRVLLSAFNALRVNPNTQLDYLEDAIVRAVERLDPDQAKQRYEALALRLMERAK